ncbi:SigE family RNA polymerase sigma factor [Nocardioides sp. DS6]|uniref:SigE family RNA polymerase sigma factor n=1 Tax=Nocardioides eburneus TaxID=3231482 RepID=A0ABV3T1C6_9ACTN
MGERVSGVPTFEAWTAARVPALLRFAVLVTGSRAEAEDAVQAALERAYVRWDRVARTEDPDAYVRRMIANAHVSLWRRGRRREVPVAEVRGSEADPTGAASDPMEASDRADVVRRSLAGLSRAQRAAVVLRFYEERDDAEIAALLGCAEATVRSHVHRALVAMRKELGDD